MKENLPVRTVDPSWPTTFLFVPGSRPERFAKAAASGTDAVIIDLEDSVPFDEKVAARSAVAHYARTHQVLVRINPVGSPWHTDDVEAMAALDDNNPGAGTTIMLPKASTVEDVAGTAARLPGAAIVALIESAAGILNAATIAALPQVHRLAFGNLDFCADTGIFPTNPGQAELLYAQSALVVASAAAGIAGPIAGVTESISDAEQVLTDSRHSRALGFTGKLLIHPRQVDPARDGFAPTPEEVVWAREIMKTVPEDGGSAVAHCGKMVDRPVVLRAQRILTPRNF